jgi:hypothetical protein
MKVAALAALSVLILLPGETGQDQRQLDSPANSCDNIGPTLGATAPTPNSCKSQPQMQSAMPTAQHRSRALDANGNTAGVVVSHKTGARAEIRFRKCPLTVTRRHSSSVN